MCNIAFFRKTENGERLFLEVMTDSYYIDYDAKIFCFHRMWQNDWITTDYKKVTETVQGGVFYIKVVS